jgi:hypothetical protein
MEERYRMNMIIPIDVYVWNLWGKNKRRDSENEIVFIYDFKIQSECNICYETKKTAKCKKCTFRSCRKCYDLLESNKCPQCRTDFLETEDLITKNERIRKEKERIEKERIKFTNRMQIRQKR